MAALLGPRWMPFIIRKLSRAEVGLRGRVHDRNGQGLGSHTQDYNKREKKIKKLKKRRDKIRDG